MNISETVFSPEISNMWMCQVVCQLGRVVGMIATLQQAGWGREVWSWRPEDWSSERKDRNQKACGVKGEFVFSLGMTHTSL